MLLTFTNTHHLKNPGRTTMKRYMLWATLILLLGTPAAAQDDDLPRTTVEGGFATFNATSTIEKISVSLSVNGFYVGGSARVHDRIDIFRFFRHKPVDPREPRSQVLGAGWPS